MHEFLIFPPSKVFFVSPSETVLSERFEDSVTSRNVTGADPASSILHEVPRDYPEELAAPASVQQRSCVDICDIKGDQDVLAVILVTGGGRASVAAFCCLRPDF